MMYQYDYMAWDHLKKHGASKFRYGNYGFSDILIGLNEKGEDLGFYSAFKYHTNRIDASKEYKQ